MPFTRRPTPCPGRCIQTSRLACRRWPGIPAAATSNSIAKPLAATTTKEARRGLYATMSYVDSLVGAVLDELTRLGLADNTVVSLIGDHGQHVGEQNFWVKMTNFVSIRRVQRSGHRWCCNPLCLLAFSGNCRR